MHLEISAKTHLTILQAIGMWLFPVTPVLTPQWRPQLQQGLPSWQERNCLLMTQ